MIKHSFHVAGKLMLSGEWSILTPGHSCLTLPTRGINVSIEPADEACITSPTYNLERHPLAQLKGKQSATAQFLTTAFKEVFALLRLEDRIIARNPWKHNFVPPQGDLSQTTEQENTKSCRAHTEEGQRSISKDMSELTPFHLRLENDPQTYITRDDITHKLGVGSSACTVVGIVKALALFYNIPLDTNKLFKIATTAHSKAQKNLGSGFDIAAGVNGTAIMYTTKSNALAMNYRITRITLPPDWHIAVGFSGASASTTDLIKIFNSARIENPKSVDSIVKQINKCVQALTARIKNNHIQAGMKLININQELLHQLSALCNNALETPPLTEMIKIAAACGAAAKFSGAGGGDCVIALCPDEKTKQKVYDGWSAVGFLSLDKLLLEDEASITK